MFQKILVQLINIRKFFGIEKDSFIKNTVLMDVPFLFEDEYKNCY